MADPVYHNLHSRWGWKGVVCWIASGETLWGFNPFPHPCSKNILLVSETKNCRTWWNKGIFIFSPPFLTGRLEGPSTSILTTPGAPVLSSELLVSLAQNLAALPHVGVCDTLMGASLGSGFPLSCLPAHLYLGSSSLQLWNQIPVTETSPVGELSVPQGLSHRARILQPYLTGSCLLSKDTAVPLLDTVTSVFLSWSVLARWRELKLSFKKPQSNCWLTVSVYPFHHCTKDTK